MTAALIMTRAGAGSGKTYALSGDVAGWVGEGNDPARLIAMTFTNKAAAELKGRIQARILAETRLPPQERIKKAEQLEQAAIGTVHSVGHLLLNRYALRLGLSPVLQILDEDGSSRALKAMLDGAPADRWRLLDRLHRRLSFQEIRWRPGSSDDDPATPQRLALDLLQAKRANGIPDADFLRQLTVSVDRMFAILAPAGEDPGLARPFEALRNLLRDAAARLEATGDDGNPTQKCLASMRSLLDQPTEIWAQFMSAAGLEAGKKKGNGAKPDEILEDLRAFCAKVWSSAALREDLLAFVTGLGEQAILLGGEYEEYKRERGLVDFTDLEVRFLDLLKNADFSRDLQEDFHFVAVDEFQDTNPLQLAIFQKLRLLVRKNLWIGDSKQSIYSFRSTDPELVNAAWEKLPAEKRNLDTNYRSQAGLVNLVGELFTPVFGPEARLKPKHPAKPRGLERWIVKSTNQSGDGQGLANGLAMLREEGVRLRDIAVLVRTRYEIEPLVKGCRSLGIPVLLEAAGLLQTREGALALAGLRVVLDPLDSLAAATVLHILDDPDAPRPAWLTPRIEEAAQPRPAQSEPDPPLASDPQLGRLRTIQPVTLSPAMILEQVIETLGLGDRIRVWGEFAQRSANLDGLRNLAAEYERVTRDANSAPTLTGLLSHLMDLAERQEDCTKPPYGVDAVTILTYHKAKGLQWPVVVMTGLGGLKPPDMTKPEVGGISADPNDPLAQRVIRYWPWPFRSDQGKEDHDRLRQSPEGLEADRSSQNESLRLLYVGMTRAKDRLILAHRPKGCGWLERVPGVSSLLPDGEAEGEFPLGNTGTECVVRHLSPVPASRPSTAPVTAKWLEPLGEHAGAEHPDRYWQPSQAGHCPVKTRLTVEEISKVLVAPVLKRENRADASGADADEPIELGNAFHAYFASLPSLQGLSAKAKGAVAKRCLEGFGVAGCVKPAELVAMGANFEAWAQARFPGAVWQTEASLLGPRAAGGKWSGNIDLLLLLPDGKAVVVDHKACILKPDQAEAKAAAYAGQLEAYREALDGQGIQVAELWIHLPIAGRTVHVKPQSGA